MLEAFIRKYVCERWGSRDRERERGHSLKVKRERERERERESVRLREKGGEGADAAVVAIGNQCWLETSAVRVVHTCVLLF